MSFSLAFRLLLAEILSPLTRRFLFGVLLGLNLERILKVMKMYVGNIPFSTSDDELRDLFGDFGAVTDVHIPQDRESGRPRGFAFVTLDSKEAMDNAIKDLDGAEFGGRNLRINEAKPREEGGGGRGGRGGNRGGGGGRDRDRW